MPQIFDIFVSSMVKVRRYLTSLFYILIALHTLAVSVDLPALWEECMAAEDIDQTQLKRIKAAFPSAEVLVPEEPTETPDFITLVAEKATALPEQNCFLALIDYPSHDNCRAQFGPDTLYSPPES
jgi:hypothetical protein